VKVNNNFASTQKYFFKLSAPEYHRFYWEINHMENKNDISVKDALDRLSLPAFYNDDERIMAYYIIMESGNPVQKVLAEKAIGEYPLEEFAALGTEAA
jgi:hypothetical protein